MSLLQQYKDAANLFYGNNTGDALYGFLERLCAEAFNNEITAEIPIILTTAQSSYNRFSGWYSPAANTIELVRYHCKSTKDGIVPRSIPKILMTLAHEFCHVYQYQVLGGKTGSRGAHRCRSWYDAIAKASPFVTGVDIDGICKPLISVREGNSVKKVSNPDSLTEVELTHFPNSIFKLLKENDKRLKNRIVGSPSDELVK